MKFVHIFVAACVALLLMAVSFTKSPANAAGLKRTTAFVSGQFTYANNKPAI